MASRIDVLLKVISRVGDGEEIISAVGSFGEPDEVAAILWNGLRSGKLPAGKYRTMLPLLAGAPGAWGADDFLALVASLEKHHPGDATESRLRWKWQRGIGVAGADQVFDLLITEKKGDPAFAAAIKAALPGLPSPWRVGIAHLLALHGLITDADVPDAWLDVIAVDAVKKVYWNASSPVEKWCAPGRWAMALGRVCSAATERLCEDYECVFPQLVDHPDPAVVVHAMRFTRVTSNLAYALKAIASLPAAAIPTYEEAIRQVDIERLHVNDRTTPWPAAALIFGYLHCCRRAGHTPFDELDPIFIKALDCIQFRWSGGQIQELHASMQDAMAALSAERQDAIVLGTTVYPWFLVAGCPTPAILKATVDNILAMKRIRRPSTTEGYYLQDMIGWLEGEGSSYYNDVGVLHRIRVPLIPYMTAGLKKKKSAPVRRVLVNLLKACDTDAAGEALVFLLADSAKGNRTAAIKALQRLRPAALRPKVVALAEKGRSKPAREAAAEVLTRWP